MNVFELLATIKLDTSEYESGIAGAGKETEAFSSKLAGGLGTAAKVGATAVAAVGTAAVALTTSIIKNTSETAQLADNIDKASQKMGVSAEFYQEWDAVLQHSGTSMDSMSATFKTLANASQDASKDQQAAFERLGLSMEQVQSMSTEELFESVITGLQGMEEGTERTALATDLLGRGAMEMGALLNTSAEDTQAMIDTVHELGGVLSDDAIKAGAAFQDSLQDLQTSFNGVKNGLMAEFLPSLTTVMDGLTAIFSGDESGVEKINKGLEDFVNNITDKLPALLENGTQIVLTLADAIINNLPTIIEAGAEVLVQLAVGLVQAIPLLISKLPEIIMAIINGFKNSWPQIKQAGADLITQIGEGIKPLASKALTWGRDVIDNFIQGIKDKIAALKETVSNVAQTVKNFLGFSEPKEGPLSNFHTYAPDMMDLFAQGIKDNESIISSQISKSFDIGEQITSGAKTGVNSDLGGVYNIVVQSVLDGKIIGETAYKWQKNYARAMGV